MSQHRILRWGGWISKTRDRPCGEAEQSRNRAQNWEPEGVSSTSASMTSPTLASCFPSHLLSVQSVPTESSLGQTLPLPMCLHSASYNGTSRCYCNINTHKLNSVETHGKNSPTQCDQWVCFSGQFLESMRQRARWRKDRVQAITPSWVSLRSSDESSCMIYGSLGKWSVCHHLSRFVDTDVRWLVLFQKAMLMN